jgi:hypothetical protein
MTPAPNRNTVDADHHEILFGLASVTPEVTAIGVIAPAGHA